MSWNHNDERSVAIVTAKKKKKIEKCYHANRTRVSLKMHFGKKF
jgi:hypothetical protein